MNKSIDNGDDWMLETADTGNDDEEEYYHPPSPAHLYNSDNTDASPSRWSDDDSLDHNHDNKNDDDDEYDDDDDDDDDDHSPIASPNRTTPILSGPTTPDTEPHPSPINATASATITPKTSSNQWQEAVDFDSILISVENKLKAPFSSLDFAKMFHSSTGVNLTIPFIKGSSSQQYQYEQQQQLASRRKGDESSSLSWCIATYISLLTPILHRMTKPIQLQLLVALLGITDHHQRQPQNRIQDTCSSLDQSSMQVSHAIQGLLERAQRLDMDEWVRVLAGTIQGLLFLSLSNHCTDDDDDDPIEMNHQTSRVHYSWGLETQSLWNKANDSILSQLLETARRDLNHQTMASKNNAIDGHYLQRGAVDAYPFYVPFYYSLLPQSFVESSIPDPSHLSFNNNNNNTLEALPLEDNPNKQDRQFINIGHFTMNTKAKVLMYDESLEMAKAAEEEQQQQQRQYQLHKIIKKEDTSTYIHRSTTATGFHTTSSSSPATTGTMMNASNISSVGYRPNVGGMNDNIKRRGIAAGGGGEMTMARGGGRGGEGTVDTSKLVHNPTMAYRNVPVKSTTPTSSTLSQSSSILSKNLKIQKTQSSSMVTTSSSLRTTTTPTIEKVQSLEHTNHTSQDEHEKRMNERKRKILEMAAAAGLRKKK